VCAMMSSTVVILMAAAIYLAMYFTYGKGLERKVVKADPNRTTPAHKYYDGVDYVPAHPAVLYGHHFASISGAGPIVGPAVAMAWGWLPGLLWVWLGNIFIGAVHDYLALMSSVRHDGKSVQWMAGNLMSKRTGYSFTLYILFALLLVLAAFMAVIAGIFSKTPEVATASLIFMGIAVFIGWLMYRVKFNFYASTAIGLVLLAIGIWVGFKFPIKASFQTWLLVLLVYSIVASSLPVWVLAERLPKRIHPLDRTDTLWYCLCNNRQGFDRSSNYLIQPERHWRKSLTLLANDTTCHCMWITLGIPLNSWFRNNIQAA